MYLFQAELQQMLERLFVALLKFCPDEVEAVQMAHFVSHSYVTQPEQLILGTYRNESLVLESPGVEPV